MSKVIAIQSEEQLNEILQNEEGYVLLDFWASWCGPCKALMPTIEEIAQNNPSLKVLTINVDELNDVAAKHRVRSIPMLTLYKENDIVEVLTPVRSVDTLKSKIQDYLEEEESITPP